MDFFHSLKIAARSLWGSRLFGGLNLLGLSTGMAACLLIAQYVRFEKGYDRQRPTSSRIWRAYNQTMVDGALVTEDANTHSILGPSLKNDLPDIVEDFTRMFNRSQPNFVFLRDEQPIRIEGAWLTDPGFLRMFPQRAIVGNLEQALDEPYNLILSRSGAVQLFGSPELALGKTLKIPEEPFSGQFTVKAVVENQAANTHLKFNALASYATRYAQGHRDNWDTYWEYTYFQLAPNADPARIRARLAEYSQAHLQREGIQFAMQKHTDIHLFSNLTYEIEPNGSAQAVQFLGIVALLVLLVAFTNYINLSAARSLRRMREVGVRKVIGASRWQLLRQFLLEGALLNLASLVVALALVQVAIRPFSELLGAPLDMVPGFDTTYWAMSAGLWAFGTLGASLWPALSLSSFSPLISLKTNAWKGKTVGGLHLQHGLVVFQFACSVALIVAVLAIQSQLSYMKSHDKGMSLNQVLTLRMPSNDWRLDSITAPKIAAMKREIAQLPAVQSISGSYIVPGVGIGSIYGSSNPLLWLRHQTASAKATTYFLDIEPEFFNTYGIKTLAGKIYQATTQAAADRNVMINEAACKMLGFPSLEAAVGEEIAFENSRAHTLRIHGVVADFNIESLKAPTKPMIYYPRPWLRSGYLSIKVGGTEAEKLVTALGPIWQQYWPQSPIEWAFADEQFDRQYRSEQRLGQVFGLFAMLAVMIACLGLFGLSAFTTAQRTKEIGIRKVLGATVTQVTAMLTSDFLKWVLVAIVVASPVAYKLMQSWLNDFAYRIQLQWWMFVAAGLAALFIAALTVGLHSVRAALANPTKSLKME